METKEKEEKKKVFLPKLSTVGMIKVERGASGSPSRLTFKEGFESEVVKQEDTIIQTKTEYDKETEISSRPEVKEIGASQAEIKEEPKAEKGWKKFGLKIDTEAIDNENKSTEKSEGLGSKGVRKNVSKWTMIRNNLQLQVKTI